LRIIARRGKASLFYLNAFFYSTSLNRIASARFLLDTGATTTCISELDAIKNTIDYSKLIPAPPVRGVGSVVSSFYLPQCTMLFLANDGYHLAELPFVIVFRNDDLLNPEKTTTQSLIGVDILTSFKIAFVDNYMVLEK